MINKTLPLLDLHHHLDGSIRLETILDLGKKHDITLPANDLEGLRPVIQITEPRPGVMAFVEKMVLAISILADYDACKRIAYENVEDAYNDGLDYIELRFSPMFMAEPHGLSVEGVVEAVVLGVREALEKYDIQVGLIGIISRHYGQDLGWKELEALLAYREHFTALDLAGDEINFPGNMFIDHFKEGRAAGWNITVHAGEEGGPENIWQAVEELGAKRIGHAVSAVKDPMLMDFLAENRIGLECNLTSNLQTRVVDDLVDHPLRIFLENGILATINTDDPGISAIDLKHEYEIAAPQAGLSNTQIQQAQVNALEVAFIDQDQKHQLKEKASRRI